MPSTDHPTHRHLHDLSDLVAGALNGHRSSWSELVERFDPLITNTLRGYRLNPTDLEDLRQDVWAGVVRHLKDLREPRAFPGWVVKIARHEAARWCSTARRRAEPTDALLIAHIVPNDEAATSVDRDLVRTEIRSSVRIGLNELPAGDRDLMLLLFGDDDLSYRDISHTLGIPPGRIGPTRARCLQKLRRTRAVAGLVA